ncbi:MAG: ABC-2 transporter permease [Oscillospiraceae bacterium]|nr:ABC-2 transporter permease [Oscillospiraceae bacterium]
MKALLRKDLYILTTTLSRVAIVYLIFPVVALINPKASFFLFYVGLLGGTLSSTMISYDNNFGWTTYAETLPISRRTVVGERYLFSLMLILVSTLIGAICYLSYILRGKPEYASFPMLLQMASLSLIMPSVLLPFSLRYGTEKARYIVMFLVIGITMVSQSFFTPGEGELTIPADFSPVMFAATVVLFIGSYFLSVKWYQDKESV